MNAAELLDRMDEVEASDLHLKAGAPPVFRIHGRLTPSTDVGILNEGDLQHLYESITHSALREQFEQELELDFSISQGDSARYRVNVSRQRRTLSMAIRRIPLEIPTLEELGLPSICRSLALKLKGLILVTGPTGSGKSTTLAAMIEGLNQDRAQRIVTIEDPIEYVYQDQRSLITQRELGQDTRSFARATIQALRQDPDVILVGEMRNPETMAACLTAAETGHLVLSTLHTNSAPQTIDRIIDSFPSHQQGQIRMQLSMTLEAVLSQALLPRADGMGRVPAVEIMIATPAIRNLIREGKTHQMLSVIQTGREAGMQTMDQALDRLLEQGLITPNERQVHSNSPTPWVGGSSPGLD